MVTLASSPAALRTRHCQGLCVDSGAPCKIRKNLNKSGYCKFHDPTSLQCVGIAKSTGVQCRIKWDLNGNQLCCHHVDQVGRIRKEKDRKPVEKEEKESKEEKAAATKEKDKKKQAASTPTPTPSATLQCRGIAKTGVRCQIKWGLNGDELCKYHNHQQPAFSAARATARNVQSPLIRAPRVVTSAGVASQCRGIAASTSKRCRVKWDLNADGLCKYHVSQVGRARM